MRKFREEYQNELDQIPADGLSAERIWTAASSRPEERARGRRRAWTRAAAAAAILVVCSAGSVTAVNIHRSYIRVNDEGYSLSKEDPQEMAETELSTDGGVSGEPEEDYFFEESIDDGREYASLEEFRESEELDFVCPEPEWLLGENEPQQETLYVSGEGDTITYLLCESEERYLFVSQWDTRGAEDYSSSTSYDGKSANERTYVTEKGFDFLLFDSEEDGETLSTHAVISLNGRELTLDFYGYSQETIEGVLERLDLEVYLK